MDRGDSNYQHIKQRLCLEELRVKRLPHVVIRESQKDRLLIGDNITKQAHNYVYALAFIQYIQSMGAAFTD